MELKQQSKLWHILAQDGGLVFIVGRRSRRKNSEKALEYLIFPIKNFHFVYLSQMGGRFGSLVLVFVEINITG